MQAARVFQDVENPGQGGSSSSKGALKKGLGLRKGLGNTNVQRNKAKGSASLIQKPAPTTAPSRSLGKLGSAMPARKGLRDITNNKSKLVAKPNGKSKLAKKMESKQKMQVLVESVQEKVAVAENGAEDWEPEQVHGVSALSAYDGGIDMKMLEKACESMNMKALNSLQESIPDEVLDFEELEDAGEELDLNALAAEDAAVRGLDLEDLDLDSLESLESLLMD